MSPTRTRRIQMDVFVAEPRNQIGSPHELGLGLGSASGAPQVFLSSTCSSLGGWGVMLGRQGWRGSEASLSRFMVS